jgi:hypothetical protein
MAHPNAINVAEAANAAQRREAEYRAAMEQLTGNLAALQVQRRAPVNNQNREMQRYLRRTRQLIAENETARRRSAPPPGVTWWRNRGKVYKLNTSTRLQKLERYMFLHGILTDPYIPRNNKYEKMYVQSKMLLEALGISNNNIARNDYDEYMNTLGKRVHEELVKARS